MKHYSTQTRRKDVRLLEKSIFNYSKKRLLMFGIMLAVVFFVWLIATRWILSFGERLNYSFINQFTDKLIPNLDLYLNEINPYIWLGVILILTLIVISSTYQWLKNNLIQTQQVELSAQQFKVLAKQLSPQALMVLNWVWDERRYPITVGDLYNTRAHIKTDRFNKLLAVEEQTKDLDMLLNDDITTINSIEKD